MSWAATMDASRILGMKTFPEKRIAEAFALSTARGADLLARLGSFKVWQGDLATMRGDDPRQETHPNNVEAAPMTTVFVDTLVLARAIELLPPICRAALSDVYAEHKDTASVAADLDTEPASAQRIMMNCERRLIEIFASLENTSRDDAAAVPQWVSEREQAAASGGRRR
jgi:hypothetical protein